MWFLGTDEKTDIDLISPYEAESSSHLTAPILVIVLYSTTHKNKENSPMFYIMF